MKKSAKITLTVVAAVGMAACQRSRRDPCDSASFDAGVCQDAVRNGGYHYHGTWIPMVYSHPYPYYYDSHSQYVSRGGAMRPAESGAYARPGGSGSVTRGGFGATGSSHGSSGGSHGAGA